jgi:Peptidase family M41
MPRPRRHPGRKALAYHEAGHAVVGYALGLEIEQITIIPNETSLGQCRYRGWETSGAAGDLDRHLRLILAGAVAEEIAMGAPSRGSDERRALDLALSLEEKWPAVRAVATALRRDRELDGPEAMGALRRAFRKSAAAARAP